MVASHSQNKTLSRIEKILEFIEVQYRSNPEKETLTLDASKIFRFDPLLDDTDLLKMSFGKIADETEGNIKIELRQGPPRRGDTTDPHHVSYDLYVWFYVEDQSKFKEYQNSVRLKIERETKVVQFVLDSQGFFYPEGAELESRHQLKRNSDRYQLLYLLAKEKEYLPTKEIAEKLDVSSLVIRKKVDEIRKIVTDKWGLPRETLFESNNTSGYRVTNVTVKES